MDLHHHQTFYRFQLEFQALHVLKVYEEVYREDIHDYEHIEYSYIHQIL